MIHRIPLALFLYLGCVSMSSLTLGAENDVVFNTVRVQGRNYVNLADFVRYYKFESQEQRGLEVVLSSKYRKLQLRLQSREARLNGILIWLNDAPLDYRNSILISEVDVRKSFDPLLRSWGLEKRKVDTIMIDPGHGGEDNGTLGYRSTQEKRLALDLSFRVEKLLKQNGFRTLMTRRTDSYVSLEDRSQLANSSDADIFVSIHFNSAKPNAQPRGIETYCLTPVGLSSTGSIRRRLGIGEFGEEAGNRFDKHNMLLAYMVQQKLVRNIEGAEDRGVKRARFYVIKATSRPSILIEGGFLSNPSEESKILTAAYRDSLAVSIVEGIKRYAEVMESRSVENGANGHKNGTTGRKNGGNGLNGAKTQAKKGR